MFIAQEQFSQVTHTSQGFCQRCKLSVSMEIVDISGFQMAG